MPWASSGTSSPVEPAVVVPEAAALAARSRSSWRSFRTSIRLRTSNGTMEAAACGIWLTAAAILSAVRSCRSLPSSGE